jgi:two-component system, response regulator PdtaR
MPAPRDSSRQSSRLRVVVSNEHPDVIEETAAIVEQLGHEVVGRERDIDETVAAVLEHGAGLAVVATHEHPEHALELIERLNDTAACPVVLLLEPDDSRLARDAIERGIAAFADPSDPTALDNAIALAVRIFDELHEHGRQIKGLEAGGERRGVIERAKGVLMERHDIDEARAYLMLRHQARASRSRLVDVAEAVLAARSLFVTGRGEEQHRAAPSK